MTVLGFTEYRCQKCKKLLCKGTLVEGIIEVRCKHCHTFTTIESSKFDQLLCAVYPCPHRVVIAKKIAKK